MGHPAVANAGDPEQQAEAPAGRGDAGQCSAEGSCLKKFLTPHVKPKAVQHLMDVHELSECRICKLAELHAGASSGARCDASPVWFPSAGQSARPRGPGC